MNIKIESIDNKLSSRIDSLEMRLEKIDKGAGEGKEKMKKIVEELEALKTKIDENAKMDVSEEQRVEGCLVKVQDDMNKMVEQEV